ncbi:hypothetical protein [Gemmata massiliana]|nr:hypothetical protein [Gemmata massiliana]
MDAVLAINGDDPLTLAVTTALMYSGYDAADAWCFAADAVGAEQRDGELLAQTSILRDLFGNPFRPVLFSPHWRTAIAVSLAQRMYESRDYAAMPLLGDALQGAGCNDDDVLNHCRGTGPHIRGCWVVDAVLGKE